jgi:hypothetical protein
MRWHCHTGLVIYGEAVMHDVHEILCIWETQ